MGIELSYCSPSVAVNGEASGLICFGIATYRFAKDTQLPLRQFLCMSKPDSTLSSYLNIIPLAGVCDFAGACRTGLSVEDNVEVLKRFHFALKRSYFLVVSRIAATPIYEVKMAFSYHANLLAENITKVRVRVGEMREPPLGLEVIPDPAYALFFDEMLSASTLEETMVGLYGVALPALVDAIRAHLRETNLLVDQPSVRMLKHLLIDLEEIIEWGEDTLRKLIEHAGLGEKASLWLKHFRDYLAAAGGISGREPRPSTNPDPRHSTIPFVYDSVPKRDSRFKDPFNNNFRPEALLYDPQILPSTKVLILLFKRFREIDVPEMMASIIWETPDKPWEYYADMTRQLWDEARHALMGEVGFVAKGIDWSRLTIRHVWAYDLNTRLTPLARHGVLYKIEKGLMPKTGKRYEWEVAMEADDPLSATFQDYDWADEVLHARIGRDWYVSEFRTAEEALNFPDAQPSDPGNYQELGFTDDHDWWPEFYRYACEAAGLPFDKRAIINHAVAQGSKPRGDVPAY
jgi:hypothetical protein